MRLDAWIRAERLTLAGAAARIGLTTPEVVRRYRAGLAIPRPAIMRRIYVATGGEVQPNDFYNLPSLERKADAAAVSAGNCERATSAREAA